MGLVQFDRNAVVTIQGGGLYGLTLLGQMSAAIAQTNILAIAGTSAGAIIAALIWAGWTPAQLRDRIAHDARRRYLHHLPGDFDPPENPFDFRSWSSLYGDIASALGTMVRGTRVENRFWRSLGTLAFWYEARRILNEASPHYQNRGVFVGNRLEQFVEDLLREAIGRKGCHDLPTSPLTFQDIRLLTERHPEIYFPPLILAATNVGTQNVELINSLDQKYEGLSIARAVRASSGYPVFFRPVELPELKHASWFIDGGVISNFPAWVFSRQFREKIASGNPSFDAIAIACVDTTAESPADLKVPCGACRQVMQEFARPETKVFIEGMEPLSVSDLLPMPFRLR